MVPLIATHAFRGRVAVDELRPGAYLTDGRRLLRVVSQLDPRARRLFAALEDCLTLEIKRYSGDELYGMGLRLVRLQAAVNLAEAEGDRRISTQPR